MEALRDRFVRAHLLALLVVTCVTSYSSYAYFHPDEYFQVLHLARIKLGQVSSPAVPWEIAAGMRPWMQPAAYVALGKALAALGLRDPFAFAFACRLVTGLVGVATVATFLAATLPWLADDEERRAHERGPTSTAHRSRRRGRVTRDALVEVDVLDAPARVRGAERFLGHVGLGAEVTRGLADGLVEGEVLVRVERVVVDEHADRPLVGEPVRGALDGLEDGVDVSCAPTALAAHAGATRRSRRTRAASGWVEVGA